MMGPSFPSGEPAMDTFDWRAELPSDSRSKIANKIMETLKRHLPFSGPEGTNELMRIATRFEEVIFSNASSQSDYLRKISMKMLTMEAKAQKAANSSSSTPATDNSTPLDSDDMKSSGVRVGHLMENNNNSWPSLPKEEPAIDTTDWRTQLPPDSRQKIITKISETLKKHLPFSGPEGLNELRRIATRFEEKIFSGAVNQTDYLRKISMKMLTMETKSQNAAASSSSKPLDLDHLMGIEDSKHYLQSEVPAMNTGEWRTQLPADSRQKIVNKIMENLIKREPNAGKGRINELMGVAANFEELVFSTAINQEDYLGQISSKMQAME